MSKFNLDTKEYQRILLMHKSLMNEQQGMTDPETTMRSYMDIKCLKDGTLLRDKKTGEIYYEKKTEKGNTIRYFSNMTYKVTDQEGTQIGSARWNCNEIVNEINKLKSDNWKSIDELSSVPREQLEDPNLYDKHTNYELYRSKKDAGTPSQYTDDQLNIIQRYREYNYHPRNEFPIGTVNDENCIDLSERHPNIFSNKVEVCIDRSLGNTPPSLSKTSTASEPTNSSEQQGMTPENEGFMAKGYAKKMLNQQIKKKDCRPLAKLYYDSWRNKVQLADEDFYAMKNDVQTCVNQHNFNRNIFSKSDNFIRIMTGNEPGQGPGSGPDNNGRVWLITPRRR